MPNTWYPYEYAASVVTAVLIGGLTVITAGNPADYGLSPVLAHWLTVVLGMLGVLASFLPSVSRTPTKVARERAAPLVHHE